MPLLIKTGHKDEVPFRPAEWHDVQLAELAGDREYVLKHPYFPVELRAKPIGTNRGRNRGWTFSGDYQLRVHGRSWPRTWLESTDISGIVHDLCFDAVGPRLEDAMASIRYRLERRLKQMGIDDELPDAEKASRASLLTYSKIPMEQWR